MSDPDPDPEERPGLDLAYPCPWAYTLIVEEASAARAVVARVVGDLEHTLVQANESRGGRYRSFHLEVVVESDEQRHRLFQELHADPVVRYVL